jgi:hypothetical protein
MVAMPFRDEKNTKSADRKELVGMLAQSAEPHWLSRATEAPSHVEEIRLPSEKGLSQGREWFEAVIDGEARRATRKEKERE